MEASNPIFEINLKHKLIKKAKRPQRASNLTHSLIFYMTMPLLQKVALLKIHQNT